MKFFIPNAGQEVIDEKRNELKEKKQKAIRSFSHMHDGSRIDVKVGEPRREFKRKTGPRGGYIPHAELERIGKPTGTVITLIVEVAGRIDISSEPDRYGVWSNPSYSSIDAVLPNSIEYFELD